MVYDDTRWVQRLQLIGCWNEAAARARGEESRRKKLEALNASREEQLKKNGIGVDAFSAAISDSEQLRKPGQTLSTARGTQGLKIPINSAPSRERQNDEDGFDFTTLSPITSDLPSARLPLDTASILNIISEARSIRGAARQEYGRIHAGLAPFYKDAIKSKHPSNARIFRVYRDPNQQAKMLAQLSQFAKGDISQGWQQRETKLEQMISAFEDAVSREFDQGLKIQDVDGRMRKYSHVLVTLNGGQRAVERFISDNPIIKDRLNLGDPMDCVSPSNADHLFLVESHSFFSHLSSAFNSQVSIIDQVFPASVNVIVPFLQRVGVDVIATYLTTLFSYLHERSMESYIRAVSGIYEQSLRFAKSLQPPQHSGDEFYETLDQTITKVFEPHVPSYLTEEMAFFKRRSEIEVGGWERQLSQQDASVESMYMSNVNRQADKRDFLTSFKKVVMMPVNVLPTFPMTSRFNSKPTVAKALVNGDKVDSSQLSSSEPSTRPSTPIPVNGSMLIASRSSTPVPEPPTTELAAKAAIMKSRLEGIRSLFSLEVALNLVHMAKASIERAAVFTKVQSQFDADARTQCEAIFILLLKILGTRHVRAGFDQAVEHLSKYNPRSASNQNQPGVAPLVVFLELVNVGDLIQQMLDVFYEQELVGAKLTDRNDFLNPTIKEKKRFEQMLDERVAAGLNKGIEVLMAEVEFICATTQKVEDFNPGATGVAMIEIADISPSSTAVWIVEVVSAHTKMLVGSTDKNMLDVFNQEVGLRLFTALCKHLKRQRISVAGSIRLIRYCNL